MIHRLFDHGGAGDLNEVFAFQEACRELGLTNRTDPLCDLVAQKVVEIAQSGVRDPLELRDQVLKAIRE